ncbi:condensation domain-containing protein [Microbulbifer variabilis]|uniref:Condensation domain-containing protein n=1 Tax=Microbulbifer variabilis TaxID=266805 RepID=A0ABY4V9Z1_9GAMM|nr:condensation domain-containing protein [Microbulbifer variabilis]USD20018.1 condensation domain-containing protein [Microbulbifer variabilis]
MSGWKHAADVPLSITERSIYNLHYRKALADMIARAISIKGALQIDLFREAVQRTVNTYPIVRCRYTREPVRRIFADVELDILDVRGMSDSHVKSFLTQYSNAPIALDTDQLLSLSLIRTGEDEYIFLTKCHHIITDGISLSLLWGLILSTYLDLESGAGFRPQPEIIDYADYVGFENNYIRSQRGQKALQHWQNKLARQRGAIEVASSGKGVSLYCEDLVCTLYKKEFSHIKERARAAGVSHFVYLCAGFQQALFELLQKDFWMNTSLSLRIKREHRKVLGPMFRQVNLAVVAEETWLKKLRRMCKEIHYAVRTVYVADSIGPHGIIGNNLPAPCTYLINFLQTEVQQEGLQAIYNDASSNWVNLNERVKMRSMSLPTRITPYGIYLSLAAYGGHLHSNFVYNANCFSRDTVQKLSDRWRFILENGC